MELFDPDYTWKRKRGENFRAQELRVQLFQGGRSLTVPRSVNEIKEYCTKQVDTLWDEGTRFENPHKYYVDLSQKLWDVKNRLISEHTL